MYDILEENVIPLIFSLKQMNAPTNVIYLRLLVNSTKLFETFWERVTHIQLCSGREYRETQTTLSQLRSSLHFDTLY